MRIWMSGIEGSVKSFSIRTRGMIIEFLKMIRLQFSVSLWTSDCSINSSWLPFMRLGKTGLC